MNRLCVCMGGTAECVPPWGTSGGCSLSDDAYLCGGCCEETTRPEAWWGVMYCPRCVENIKADNSIPMASKDAPNVTSPSKDGSL